MLTKMLRQSAQAAPDKPAIVQGNRRISYSELYRLSGCAGEGLRQLGIRELDCVAVVLPNCPEFIISLFACARLGSVMLPLNPQYTKDELQRFLADAQAKIIITDSLRAALCQQIIAEADGPVTIVVVDDVIESALHFEQLLDNPEPTPPTETLTGDALYLYTSGSTSEYKRLCCTHENLYYEAHNFVETIGLTADDPILCTVPMYHSYGLGNGLLDAAYTGSTLVLLEPVVENGVAIETPFISRSREVLKLIREESIRFFPGVPYQFGVLAELPDDWPADLSRLKWCISSGDVLTRRTYERFLQRFGIAVRSLYGSTEAGSICINTDPLETVQFGSLGLPLNNVEIQIRDQQGRECSPGTSGVIWVKSSMIPPRGYDNLPELSAQMFFDGFYDTGDIGKKDARGHLIITGRKQTFVDVGGYKVDIGELEEVLQSHPNVNEAAVLGITIADDSEMIKAVLVTHEDCSETEILDYCRERLAAYKLPRIIEFRDQLPRSPLGKILKKELHSTETSNDTGSLSPQALQTLLTTPSRQQQIAIIAGHIQEKVAATLQIEIDQVVISDSFQQLGFNSIQAVELQNRLSQLTGLALPITLPWNYPTILELSAVILDKMQANPLQTSAVSTSSKATVDNKGLASAASSLDGLLNEIEAMSDDDVDTFFQNHPRPGFEPMEMIL